MTPELKTALAVKGSAIEIVKEEVYRGDYDRPRLDPDSNGWYHYRDKKIQISCCPSPRDGWLNCSVRVYIIRKSWLSSKLELVLSTGFGVDVAMFRAGQWVHYLSQVVDQVHLADQQRETDKQSSQEDVAQDCDPNFSPVDDSSIFR